MFCFKWYILQRLFITLSSQFAFCLLWRVWRYQRGNQNP